MTLEDPRLLDEVISVTDAMRVNWRASGVATDEAMVSGLAPGKPADTETVGKSTWGRGDTGRSRKATAPAKVMAMRRSVVATGLRIKGSEIFTGKKFKWQKAKGKIQIHLPFALCHLPFEIPFSSFALCYLPFEIALILR